MFACIFFVGYDEVFKISHCIIFLSDRWGGWRDQGEAESSEINPILNLQVGFIHFYCRRSFTAHSLLQILFLRSKETYHSNGLGLQEFC